MSTSQVIAHSSGGPGPTYDNSPRRPGSVVIHISNLDMLVLAYGMTVKGCIQRAVAERLYGCGLESHRLSSKGAVFLVELQMQASSLGMLDRLLERLRAAIEGSPVECDAIRLYLQVRLDVFYEPEDGALTDVQEAFPASGSLLDRVSGQYVRIAAAALRSDLMQAGMLLDLLHDGALALAFQPIMRTDGTILYHEALLRHGPAAPAPSPFSVPHAIVALERIGGAERLDQSVVWTCLKLLQAHPEQRLGCNVSAASLHDAAWWRLLVEHLAAHPQLAGRLVLEITETSAAPSSAAAFALVKQLRDSGVRIAIDDMGTGHSTLEFLARSQADIVKMDRSLLTHAMQIAGTGPELLRNLVAACSVLCPCVVVEGIETPAEFTAAQQSGARGLQGFLIQAPDLHPSWLRGRVAVVVDGHLAALRAESAPLAPHESDAMGREWQVLTAL